MKTTDLIPIILYQLVDGDKYGYEIIKQIQEKTNNQIEIRQPTLYGILRKLEQNKFILSYWKDSEIGGKRHYYSLTDNGKSQLDTYPALDVLIKDIANEDIIISPAFTSREAKEREEMDNNITPSLNNDFSQDTSLQSFTNIDQTSISENGIATEETQQEETSDLELDESDDTIIDEVEIKPIDISLTNDYEYIKPLPIDISLNSEESDETFNSTGITLEDVVSSEENTYTDINIELNSNIVKEESKPKTISIFDAIDFNDIEDEQREQTEDHSPILDEQNIKLPEDKEDTPKFAENIESINESPAVNKLYGKLTPNADLASIETVDEDSEYNDYDVNAVEEIKYLNYVDFDTDKNVIRHKKAVAKHLQKMTLTCITLLAVLISSFILCYKYSFSKIYYIFAIVACLIIVLYPILLISKRTKIRLKYCLNPFVYSLSRDFFIKLSLFLSLAITTFAYNLTIMQSINEIFTLNNCANFLCPILFSGVIMLDFVYSLFIYKKHTK